MARHVPRMKKEGATARGDLPEFKALAGRFKGPKPRDIEDPATVYTGPNIRLTLDGGDTYNIEAKTPLTGEKADRATAAGFDQVDEEGKYWQASKQAVAESGKDINVLAIALDDKGPRIGRGR